MPGFIAAFSSAEKAASFMVSRGETEWETGSSPDQLFET
jgi:hypothetical protein